MVGFKILYNWGRIAYFITSSPVNKTHTEDLAVASASLPLRDPIPSASDPSALPPPKTKQYCASRHFQV